jgi:DNA adenine methylase
MPTLISSKISPEISDAVTPRPFLKWAGGKGQLIQQYLPHFPRQFDTYYEPFLGGGAIFFHLLPTQAVLTDLNPELVNVYCCIRDRVEEVIFHLQYHQQHHCREHYYQVRSQLRSQDRTPARSASGKPAVERAAQFIYLNRTCFNGLYRENSKGQFNVPMGSYKSPRICYPELLYAVAHALQRTQIEMKPFDHLRHQATPKDFVYFDPPYHPISATSRFTSYNRYSFGADDQIRLRDTFTELAQRGVKVMLSNSDCPFVRELYREFNIHTIYAGRSINSNAQRRGKITEVLVTSY